jgi:hypothetical protein
MSPPAAPPTPPAAPDLPAEPPPGPAPGPLRNGNPRGNPNLAPRCGAKARTTGCPCRAPAMPNGRCRMHGGNCRGPATPRGRERMTAANTKHGNFSAHARAEKHHVRTFTSRNRLVCTATLLWPYLPPDMAARLAQGPDELFAPVHHSNLPFLTPQDAMPCNVKTRPGKLAPQPTGRAAERLAVRAEAASQAPWRHAIALARAAKRQKQAERESSPSPPAGEGRGEGSRRNAVQRENAPPPGDRPTANAPAVPTTPAPTPATWPALPLLQRELALRLAGMRGPRYAQPQTDAAPAPQAEPTHPRTKFPGRIAIQREPTAHPGSAKPPTALPSAPSAPARLASHQPPTPAEAHPSPAAKPKPRNAMPYNVSIPPRRAQSPSHLIPPHRRPSTAPRAAASNTSGDAAIAPPARAHDPASSRDRSKARGVAPGPHQRALPSGLPPRASPWNPLLGWGEGGAFRCWPGLPGSRRQLPS